MSGPTWKELLDARKETHGRWAIPGSGFEIPEVEGEWVAMNPLFQPTGVQYLIYGRVMFTLRALDGSNTGWRKVEKLPDVMPAFDPAEPVAPGRFGMSAS